jgi:hypothetical protein
METYLLTFFSILVSVGLFLVGYQKTIGAYKERVRTANTDLEKVLLKRIVLELYRPTTENLSRLINGKALDHRVKRRDLLSEVQFLEVLFTRIVESDFINPNQRNEILERILPVLVEAEEVPEEEIRIAELPSPRKRLFSRYAYFGIMAVFASTLGSLVILLPELRETTKLLTPSVFAAFVASLSIIIVIFITYRLRESQEETSSESAFQSEIDFVRKVGDVLKKFGVTSKLSGLDRGFDFMAIMGGKKILIEVKAWSHRVPISIIPHFVARLSQSIKAHGADEAIIITKIPVELPPDLLKDTRVRIMSLREFRNYVVHEGV